MSTVTIDYIGVKSGSLVFKIKRQDIQKR